MKRFNISSVIDCKTTSILKWTKLLQYKTQWTEITEKLAASSVATFSEGGYFKLQYNHHGDISAYDWQQGKQITRCSY